MLTAPSRIRRTFQIDFLIGETAKSAGIGYFIVQHMALQYLRTFHIYLRKADTAKHSS